MTFFVVVVQPPLLHPISSINTIFQTKTLDVCVCVWRVYCEFMCKQIGNKKNLRSLYLLPFCCNVVYSTKKKNTENKKHIIFSVFIINIFLSRSFGALRWTTNASARARFFFKYTHIFDSMVLLFFYFSSAQSS